MSDYIHTSIYIPGSTAVEVKQPHWHNRSGHCCGKYIMVIIHKWSLTDVAPGSRRPRPPHRISGVPVDRSSTRRPPIHMMAMILSPEAMPGRTLAPRARRQSRPRRMTQRAVKKRATHERILKSADNIARREGLRAASVPRVMKGAGLTVGGFYAHFSSKT